MTGLAGRSVLVTGASRGIGAATARAFAEAGASVLLAARSLDACRAEAEAIGEAGGRAEAIACDVADYAAVEATVARAVETFGGLDVVVDNAGVIEPIGRFSEVEPAEWARSIGINLVGAMHVARAAMPALADRGGTLITVSSGAAHRPLEGWSAYCAGKAGLAMLTRSIHAEEGARVRVFGLSPGVIDTEMQTTIRASGINPVSRLARSDLASPDDPARVMVWLAGPEAEDLRGQEVDVREPDIRRRAGLDP